MPEAERERRVPRAADIAARVQALEDDAEDHLRKIDEIHAAVVGTAKEAGLAERVRVLERAYRVITGVTYACAAAVAVAWATVGGGPPRPHP